MTKNELEIRFGDVFTHLYQGRSKNYVILELGEDYRFKAAQVIRIEGKEALGIGGTSYRDDIEKIVGSWSLARIINAINNNYGVSESMLRFLKENEQKPPRKIS